MRQENCSEPFFGLEVEVLATASLPCSGNVIFDLLLATATVLALAAARMRLVPRGHVCFHEMELGIVRKQRLHRHGLDALAVANAPPIRGHENASVNAMM